MKFNIKHADNQKTIFLALYALTFASIVHSYKLPLSIQPDNFEKKLGVDLVNDAEVANVDFYPKLLADEINVYYFYSKLLNFFSNLEISLVLVQFFISTLILFVILKISNRVFSSVIPATIYAVVMLFASGILVYPDFLYSDHGFAPRQFALACTIFAVYLFIDSGKTSIIGIVLGFSTLIHPSVGAISFLLISVGIFCDYVTRYESFKAQVKRQRELFLGFLLTGGWFAVFIAAEQFIDQNNLSSEDQKLATWVFSVLRLPYAVFDWRQGLILIGTLLSTVFIIRTSNSIITREKKLFFNLMFSSLFLYILFVFGITFQIPSLISLFGIRVYNLWILGSVMLAADYILQKFSRKLRSQDFKKKLFENIPSASKPYFLKKVLVFALVCFVSFSVLKISRTEQIIDSNSRMKERIESSLGSKLEADMILAPTSIQIKGSIHHWKTLPRVSSDVLEWNRRLNLITSKYTENLYRNFKVPAIVWDHNQLDFLQELSQKTLELRKSDIEELCLEFPIRVFIASRDYTNPMNFKEIYKDSEFIAYEINCENKD